VNVPVPDPVTIPDDFRACFERQRAAYLAAPAPGLVERQASLAALARLVKENREALVAAINADYGNRSSFETLFAEYFVVLETIAHTSKHLKKWMKPQKRSIDFMSHPGARNRVIPQPLGVVGVIVPWNFPLNLSFCPLAAILAAGNRAMVKMSENSQHLAALLAKLSPNYLPTDKLAFFEDGGGPNGSGRGPAFSSLPFDHLLFTGSGATGRAVMANAARNLTPVTLELGGKAPAIVAPDFPIEAAAKRILWVKMLNAGQICTNVDYVFVPKGTEDEFATHCTRLFKKRYPDINGPDFTSIIDQRAFARLLQTLEDARAKGARLINLAAGQTPDVSQRKFPPHLVLDPTDDMMLMQREIFGPILPIKTYTNRQEVADYINARDRPLALYPFTKDAPLRDFYISHVMSGGVSVNEALLHVGQHDLPFGGVGASGMGHYHGREGFYAFSKLRPVFYQGPFSPIQLLLQPPYSGLPMRILRMMLRMRT
jgi:coniferyl-aldehyde dehydrogenase